MIFLCLGMPKQALMIVRIHLCQIQITIRVLDYDSYRLTPCIKEDRVCFNAIQVIFYGINRSDRTFLISSPHPLFTIQCRFTNNHVTYYCRLIQRICNTINMCGQSRITLANHMQFIALKHFYYCLVSARIGYSTVRDFHFLFGLRIIVTNRCIKIKVRRILLRQYRVIGPFQTSKSLCPMNMLNRQVRYQHINRRTIGVINQALRTIVRSGNSSITLLQRFEYIAFYINYRRVTRSVNQSYQRSSRIGHILTTRHRAQILLPCNFRSHLVRRTRQRNSFKFCCSFRNHQRRIMRTACCVNITYLYRLIQSKRILFRTNRTRTNGILTVSAFDTQSQRIQVIPIERKTLFSRIRTCVSTSEI